MDWDSFTTAGDVFIAVANRYIISGARYNVKSAVYKMAKNKFKLYQQLPTTGAEYIHAFTHNGKQYLAVVNKFDVFTSTSDVQVFIWNSTVAAEDVGCSSVQGGRC